MTIVLIDVTLRKHVIVINLEIEITVVCLKE